MSTSRAVTSPRRPAPAPERQRHLEVVRGATVSGRRPPRRMVAILAAASVGVLLLMVTLQILLGQMAGFEHAEIEGRVAQKRMQVEELELEVARAGAPAAIAVRAARLGLVRPDRTVILTPAVAQAAPQTPSRGAR